MFCFLVRSAIKAEVGIKAISGFAKRNFWFFTLTYAAKPDRHSRRKSYQIDHVRWTKSFALYGRMRRMCGDNDHNFIAAEIEESREGWNETSSRTTRSIMLFCAKCGELKVLYRPEDPGKKEESLWSNLPKVQSTL